jgi:AP-1 complex subunit sigma 1/2
MSRQGKVRLAKWYSTYSQRDRQRVLREVTPLVLQRPLRLCNFVDWRGLRLVYRRYASLYFVAAVDTAASSMQAIGGAGAAGGGAGALAAASGGGGGGSGAATTTTTGDNELLALEAIHLYVEALDRYFGNVCELDLVFNFHKAHYVLDELLVGGELAEPSRRAVARAIEAQDQLVEQAKLGGLGGGLAGDEPAAATGTGAGVGYRPHAMGYDV